MAGTAAADGAADPTGDGDADELGAAEGDGDGAPPTPPCGDRLNRNSPPRATATTATAARAIRDVPFIVGNLHGSPIRRRV
jgi:hypothetical protein